MLPKASRLTSKEIEALSLGKTVFSGPISLRFVTQKETKFSISVSKKTLKRAVDRNRLRRKIYSALEIPIKKIKTAAYVMLMPKKECLDVKNEVLSTELEKLFEKAGFMR